MIDGTTHCWSFGPKHYECALARIAQLEAHLEYEETDHDGRQSDLIMQIVRLEAALREARDLLGEWREGNAPFTQTDMWLSITAETLADAVDRISDETMKNTKTRGW